METGAVKKITKGKAILILLAAGLLSIGLAMAGVNYGAAELGALIYLIIPILATIIALIIFFLADKFTSVNRKRLTIILAIFILALGIFLRLDFYYDIINW